MELRKKSAAELAGLLRERAIRQEELSGAIRSKKVRNVKELRAVRKDVARIRTILRERMTP